MNTMRQTNLQHENDTRREVKKETGRFSATPHEMTEIFMRADLTSREYRLIFFFIREIQGYSLRQKIIKTSKMVKDTALHRQHVHTAIHSLLKKGIIERFEVDGEPGEYLYQFNEDRLERVCATEKVKESYIEDGKVIHIKNYVSRNRLQPSNQNNDTPVTDAVTSKPVEPIPIVASEETKAIKKKEKEILRGRIEESFTLKGKSESEIVEESRAKFMRQRVLLESTGWMR